MRHLSLIFILILSASRLPLAAQTSHLDRGDQGNGTYLNPVLNADYSDPDVIRVGSKYYMVASDFHYLGMQVLESYDLLNWRIISQIYDRFDYPGWDSNAHFAGGAWAPAIRYHAGRYYVYFCTYDEGLFMSSATDPKGPWTPLHCLKEVPKWEDPCPFWDDDGQAYLGRSKWRAGPIILHRMSADGKTLLDDGVTIYEGPVAEGTKFLKRNGYYYLIIPEGGVGEGWQTVLRSRNIYGPYERQVVLEQGSTDVNGPHQGALVDTPEGDWWFFHFQMVNPTGRIVHLQPARWADDWLQIGVDIDMNGVGEPVRVWPSPYPSAGTPDLPQTDDEFTGDSQYWVGDRQRALGLQWQWNHNPADDHWSLTERKGWLTLHALPSENLRMSRNMLTQKTMGYESEAVTLIDARGISSGTYAGLLCAGDRFCGIGVSAEGIYIENDGKREVVVGRRPKRVWLKVSIDNRRNTHQFYYSLDGKKYVAAGQPFSLKWGSWKGTRAGLYCYGDGGTAAFDYFRMRVMR